METLELARIQFASTTIFHYFFVPLSIGLAFIIALMQTLYVVKGQEIYKKMTKFWTQIFLVNFAVGVVTGILQEFQFGMNWSTYSRFVGDVFGPSLAIEGLLAFFIESTFLGLWVFGEDKLPKRVHLLCIWLLSIGTMLSAFCGSVEVTPDTLAFGPIATTKMACEAGAMSVESAVLAVLSGDVAYTIDADTLTLDAGDAGLIFRVAP